ncbi:hypothetical protein CCHL11_05518 [Colletotrichum chlorophyti]|uniref:Uncharacterized protein n=1 Tax=Colletotrichum chlorophyti TaxID=708187 RepID=A0A1Q8RBA0_9PEZI|nr:hypothetical protein CCHL11_05518 [Colletotrichum chlorophyti]
MANSKSLATDSADALQGLLNDALIQTGKALKSFSKDGRHHVQGQISLQSKMPEIIENFNWKLDDLESEIIRAKAALQRDLDRIRQQRLPVPQPAPVEAQSKEPMSIDIDSSRDPTPEKKAQLTEATGPHRVPAEPSAAPSMAPFPDMGVSFQPPLEPQSIKEESAPAPPAMMAPMGEMKPETKPTSPITQTQPSVAPEAPMDDMFNIDSGDAADGDAGGNGAEGNNSEFHFTDMTFSLAPPNNEAQGQPQSQDTSMDMSFGTADIGGDLLSLDNLLPQESAAKGAAPAPSEAPATNQEKPADTKTEKQDSNLDDLFNLDGNANMESMDLDMSLGGEGGGDGSTFDDMYFGDMTEMEHGKFDDAFFGIQ